MTLLGNLTIPVVRYTSISIVKGRHVPGSDVTTNFNTIGSVQPLTAKDTSTLPEGVRDRGGHKLFTDDLLNIADIPNRIKADRVTIEGSLYEVVKSNNWKNGLINHFKSLVVQIDDKP